MKSILFFISFLVSLNVSATNIFDWGPTGHRATGKIAEKYLSKRVKRKINKLLQGESIAFVSTFADEIKSDKRYNKYKAWHYVNMPLDVNYEKSEKSTKGDLITGIEHCVKVLKDESTSDEDKRFWLKMLIHFIGDMHQPFHIGLAEDWGGNKIQVQWHGKGSNIHRVWDEDLLDKWGMSYIELANNERKLTKKQIQDIQQGTIVDWLNDSHQVTKKVYVTVKNGDKLNYRYSYDWMPTVRTQLQKGGIRLAQLLNEIFG